MERSGLPLWYHGCAYVHSNETSMLQFTHCSTNTLLVSLFVFLFFFCVLLTKNTMMVINKHAFALHVIFFLSCLLVWQSPTQTDRTCRYQMVCTGISDTYHSISL